MIAIETMTTQKIFRISELRAFGEIFWAEIASEGGVIRVLTGAKFRIEICLQEVNGKGAEVLVSAPIGLQVKPGV